MEVWKGFLSPYLAVLSANLAFISPGDLNYPFFCNSGAEANEGALKIAEKYQGAEKKVIVYTDMTSRNYHFLGILFPIHYPGQIYFVSQNKLLD